MAVHVEDHPIEYFDFEGVIPAKQYGAGDVIVWDWGTWEPEAPTLDGRKSVEDGELKFRLNGQKLKGRFTIVRTSRRPGQRNPRRAFESDAGRAVAAHPQGRRAAEAGWDAEDIPQSVKTGRTNDEVKENRDAVWISQAPAATAEIDLAGAKAAPMPQKIEPMMATLATKPFDDEDWLFEIKWDGFRVQAVVDDGKVRILTRNLNDAATYFPRLLGAPGRWLEASQAIIDGEVVAIDEAGTARLQPAADQARGQGGERAPVPGLRPAVPRWSIVAERAARGSQAAAAERAEGPSPGSVRVARRARREGVLRGRRRDGVEGMVAKLRRSRYEPGRRSGSWLKIKIRPEQELVVGGWTPGSGNARDLGAMAVGVYEDGKLRFAGKVGSGFTGAIRADLLEAAQAARSGRPAVRPGAAEGLPWPLGRRPPGHHVGPSRDRHPCRDRRLDPRRSGPPDGLQGHRGGP